MKLHRITAAIAALALISELLVVPLSGDAANGHDDPGTTITNTASAVYKDGSGNSYNTTSNTVTVTVQNAPSLTVVATAGTAYAPGQVVTDSFTLTNTGNWQGYFQISGAASAPTSSSDAVIAGSDAASATLGNNAATCTTPAGSQSAPCKYAANVGGTMYYFTSLDATTTNTSLDYWLQNTATQTTAGTSITVYVYYTMATTATTGGTVSSQIYAAVTYPTVGSAASETSAYSNATESNTIAADARLDLYKSSSQNGSTGDITYTISAHNNQTFAAKDLQSAGTLLGTGGVNGDAITDLVPQFGGSPLHLSNSGTVTVTTNATYGWGGGTATVYYSTSATGASGSWVSAGASPATLPTNGTVYYIAVFMHGGTCGTAGYELCGDTSHATTPGNANVASAAAVQLSFTIVQPTGTGSGVTGSVKNGANGLIGDNQPTEHILGGGVPNLTADGASTANIQGGSQGINNTSFGTPANGISNQTSNQALSQYAPLVGPNGQPSATGSYDGVVATNTLDDFTAVAVGQSGDNITNTSTTLGSPTTTTTFGTAETICVEHTGLNSGNLSDSYNITANVPTAYQLPSTTGGTVVSGWKVGIYSDAACSSALGGAVDGSPSATASNVGPYASNATFNFYVKYVIPVGTKYFYRYDGLVTVQSVGNTSNTDTTHDELYAGFVAITKTASVTSSGCPSGTTPSYAAGAICPGGVEAYSLDYRNLVMGTSSTNVTFASVSSQAGSLQITDDGTLSTTSQSTTPNWATFATMVSAPTDSNASSTFAYFTGIPATTSAGSWSASVTKLVDTVGGSSFQLVPAHYNSPSGTQGTQGSVTFSITVK